MNSTLVSVHYFEQTARFIQLPNDLGWASSTHPNTHVPHGWIFVDEEPGQNTVELVDIEDAICLGVVARKLARLSTGIAMNKLDKHRLRLADQAFHIWLVSRSVSSDRRERCT